MFFGLPRRVATAIRLAGLALICYSMASGSPHPAASGRGLLISVLLAAAAVSWLFWTIWPDQDHPTANVWVMAAAGGFLVEAAPHSASSAFVFIAVVTAGVRVELMRAAPVAVLGALAVAVSALVYDARALGVVAYSLGFAASLLAATASRERSVRAEQAELLLAQSQRSHEEQLRVARLEESTRIARDIHDVLAHALAGLTIQLEATTALLHQGADRDVVLERVQRAHELAREGLKETRRAVGALRSEPDSALAGVEALVEKYRATGQGEVKLKVDGDRARLTGSTGQAVLRVAQEALTNARKHAPGAAVSVAINLGVQPHDQVLLVVENLAGDLTSAPAPQGLATSGGGYGLQGMRERAQLLGGTLSAGASGTGWRVELRLPSPAGDGS
jgi:signal transduction histidine kinase